MAAAAKPKPKPHKGYFSRAYHGEERLGGLYWKNGFWISFGASFFLNLGVSIPFIGTEGDLFDAVLIRPLFLMPTVIAWIVCHVWLFKSVWKCAPNTNNSKWASAARWSLIIAGPAWLPFILANLLWQILFITF